MNLPLKPPVARNAVQAVMRTCVHYFKTGQVLAPPAVAAARKQICQGDPAAVPPVPRCPKYLKYDRCAACGCAVGNTLISKWRFAAEKCPLGKW